MTARQNDALPAAGRQEVYETKHVPFYKLHIYLVYSALALHSHHGFETFLSHFWFLFASKGMVYELSETDRVAMACSVLQPCVAAMLILIEQDQHIEYIPDFCHLCQFSGMNR